MIKLIRIILHVNMENVKVRHEELDCIETKSGFKVTLYDDVRDYRLVKKETINVPRFNADVTIDSAIGSIYTFPESAKVAEGILTDKAITEINKQRIYLSSRIQQLQIFSEHITHFKP